MSQNGHIQMLLVLVAGEYGAHPLQIMHIVSSLIESGLDLQ